MTSNVFNLDKIVESFSQKYFKSNIRDRWRYLLQHTYEWYSEELKKIESLLSQADENQPRYVEKRLDYIKTKRMIRNLLKENTSMDVEISIIVNECLKENELEQPQIEMFYWLLATISNYKKLMKETEKMFQTFPGYYLRMVRIRRTFESLEKPLLSFKEMIASNVTKERLQPIRLHKNKKPIFHYKAPNLEGLPFAESRLFQEETSPLKKTYHAPLVRYAKRINTQRANRLTNKGKIPIAKFQTVNTVATRKNLPKINRVSNNLSNNNLSSNSNNNR